MRSFFLLRIAICVLSVYAFENTFEQEAHEYQKQSEKYILTEDQLGKTTGEKFELASKGLEMSSKALAYAQKGKEAWDLLEKAQTQILAQGSVAGCATGLVGAAVAVADSVVDFVGTYFIQEEEKAYRESENEYFKEQTKLEKEQNQMISNMSRHIQNVTVKLISRMKQMDIKMKQTIVWIDNVRTSLEKFKNIVAVEYDEIIKQMTNVIDRVEKKFQMVQGRINEDFIRLDHKIRQQFLELSEFSVQLRFTEEVMLRTDILENLMMQAIKYKRRDTIEEFTRKYKNNGPRRIILELANRLKYKFANPITSAMELEVFNSRKVFASWRMHICRIVHKLLTIEGFYFGLIEMPNNKNLNTNLTKQFFEPITTAVKDLMSKFNMLSASISLDEEVYWPTIVSYNVDHILQQNTDRTDVANKIHAMLNGIHTKSVFTIHVAEVETKQNQEFKSYVNPNISHPIKEEHFYAFSPLNKTTKLSQITAYNGTLRVSITKSDTFFDQMEDDKSFLNDELLEIVNSDPEQLSTRDGFLTIVNDLNEKMGGKIGGAVWEYNPRKSASVMITHGERCPLEWYNQVPREGLFISIMWK